MPAPASGVALHGWWMALAGSRASSGTQRLTYAPSGSNFLALQDRVEDTKTGCRIGTRTGDPLAVGGVAAGSASTSVSENHFSPSRPVDQEMLDQERRRQHPHPVVHRADAPQLAHPGIDDGAWAISFQNTARPVSRASSAIIAAARPLRSTSDEPLGRWCLWTSCGDRSLAPKVRCRGQLRHCECREEIHSAPRLRWIASLRSQ
jgi:hypothetical protein